MTPHATAIITASARKSGRPNGGSSGSISFMFGFLPHLLEHHGQAFAADKRLVPAALNPHRDGLLVMVAPERREVVGGHCSPRVMGEGPAVVSAGMKASGLAAIAENLSAVGDW